MTRYCEFEHNAISPVLTLYSCSIIQSSSFTLVAGYGLFPVSASSNSKGANESFETSVQKECRNICPWEIFMYSTVGRTILLHGSTSIIFYVPLRDQYSIALCWLEFTFYTKRLFK